MKTLVTLITGAVVGTIGFIVLALHDADTRNGVWMLGNGNVKFAKKAEVNNY